MRAFVFTDRSLTRHAGRFVWLDLDSEKPRNAAIRRRLAINALPTYFIVDPATERVALRWLGGFSVAQLDRLLEDGRLAVQGGAGAGGADTALKRADALYGEGRYAEAAPLYRDALARAAPGWPSAARATDALLFSYSVTDSNALGAALALEAWPRFRRTPSAANLAATGLECAILMPADRGTRGESIAKLEDAAREALADTALGIAADDRSALYIALLDARQDAKDDSGAARVAAAWSAFLDGEAARARTPEARAVFDSHRLSAYLELNQPERAIPMLEASERDAPGDYNPPARLAVAYRAMKAWDLGLAASDRAMARAYGPRKLGFFGTRADLYLGKADTTAAAKALQWGLAYADSLPEGQRSSATVTALRKRLETLRGK